MHCVPGAVEILNAASTDSDTIILDKKNVFGERFKFTKRQWEIYTNV